MRLRRDSDEVTRVQWFKTPPTATFLGYSSPWGSSVWDATWNRHDGAGEARRFGWLNGQSPMDVAGDHTCGPREAIEHGATADDPILTNGPDGFPQCCGRVPADRVTWSVGIAFEEDTVEDRTRFAGAGSFAAAESWHRDDPSTIAGAGSFAAAESWHRSDPSSLAGAGSFAAVEAFTDNTILAAAGSFASVEAWERSDPSTLAAAGSFASVEGHGQGDDATMQGAAAAVSVESHTRSDLPLMQGAAAAVSVESHTRSDLPLMQGAAKFTADQTQGQTSDVKGAAKFTSVESFTPGGVTFFGCSNVRTTLYIHLTNNFSCAAVNGVVIPVTYSGGEYNGSTTSGGVTYYGRLWEHLGAGSKGIGVHAGGQPTTGQGATVTCGPFVASNTSMIDFASCSGSFTASAQES